MEIELMQKRVQFIQEMKESMVDMDQESNEIKFFSSKFLVKKYLKLSDKDLELNDKMKQQEIEDLNLAGKQRGEDDEEGIAASILNCIRIAETLNVKIIKKNILS